MAGSRTSATRIGTQARYLAWRSVLRTVRQPFMIVPSLSFPLFLLAVNASGLDAATKLPGFPTDSYLTFALAITFMQGALFATNMAGTNIAEDIGDGFFNRLSLTPMRGAAMLAGQLAGVLVLGLVQAVAYILVGVAFGVNVAAGVGGALVIVLLSMLVVAAFGTIGLFVGLRSGSGEAVQGLFPVMFVLLFISSMALPRNLIEQDWFRTAATWNPVSYLIEGFRSLIVTGWDAEALALGFGVATAIFAIALTAAAAALPSRMVRT